MESLETLKNWDSWHWQMQNHLSSLEDFEKLFELTPDERGGFKGHNQIFKITTTPYYASLAAQLQSYKELKSPNPIRRIFMPTVPEMSSEGQQLQDPLAESEHSPVPRIIHRYSDRVLFLPTDTCSVYCRFCTRKRFTGHDEGLIKSDEYVVALEYVKSHRGIREVIFSGGDALTISDSILDRMLSDFRSIEHVEIIRIGSRMPVVCPMRITKDLAKILRKHAPLYMMTHFNHPKELTHQAAEALNCLVDHGIPVLNQTVLLNGVNNHPAIIQALNRRLLFLRAKPYYMFQCDPSQGTDHLRTRVEDSEEILRSLWGHLSGLAIPTLCLDVPNGGGKVALTPQFMTSQEEGLREFKGWDGRLGAYHNPKTQLVMPGDFQDYEKEWEGLKSAKQSPSSF